MKNNKKKTLNDGILEFLEAQPPLAVGQRIRYPISSNLYFLSVLIRVLYQKLWLFEVS